jgi:superfamily II DNA or RNA helicase
MQCGPIRHRVDALAQAAARPFEHVLIPRTTAFNAPPEAEAAGIQGLYARLAADPFRNDLIVSDVLRAVAARRSPLVLTERTDHLELLSSRLGSAVAHLVVLRGGMGAKQRRATLARLAGIPPDEPRVLLATGRYIGEGFDDARLDTLFLTMPVSWRGTVQQYAGRLHRLHATKQVVQVYDYVDAAVPLLARMYERRLKGYKAVGYAVQAAPQRDGVVRDG